MTDMLNTILANIELAIAIVTALGALIAAGVLQYRRVRDLLRNEALEQFKEIAAQYIPDAEVEPMRLLAKLADPPVPDMPSIVNSNNGKAMISAQAAIEKAKADKPSILKRLGINSAADAVPIVSTLYTSIIKPMVKKK